MRKAKKFLTRKGNGKRSYNVSEEIVNNNVAAISMPKGDDNGISREIPEMVAEKDEVLIEKALRISIAAAEEEKGMPKFLPLSELKCLPILFHALLWQV